jgi:O-antigen/teichoic acid export membrane protein
MHNACEFKESKQKNNSGIRGRLLKGIGAQGFSQVVQIFIRLAEVPLLLSFWGTQLYGEWLMLSAIPVYLSIGDGGFAGAACREMTMRSGAGDRKGGLVVFQSTWALLIVVSLASGFLAFCFVQVAPLDDWLGFSSITAFEIKITLIFLVVYVLVGFQGGLLNGGFWVAGRYSSGMYLIAVTQLLEFGGLATAVTLGGGPVQAACGLLSGRLLGTGLMWMGQRRVSPWLRHGVSQASFSELRRLSAPAFTSLAFPLGNALNIQGIRLVVGLVLGPSALALFVPLRTLSRLVMQPANIINRLIEPEMALAYGAGDNSLFQRLFVRSCQLVIWGCFGACLLVGPGAHWIFPEWTGGKVTMHWSTYLVLLSGVLINSIWYTALMVPYAINRHGRIALSYALVYGAAAFGLGFLGATSLGLGGVAFMLLAAEAAMTVIVLHASLQMTGINMTQWAKIVLHPPFDIFNQTDLIMRKRITDMSE